MKTILHTALAAVVLLLVFQRPAAAVEKEEVNKAVQRGVEALRRSQGADGMWPQAQGIGLTALAALTLLECEVDISDPAVQKAAQAVRTAAVKETWTYSLSLSILFLDRLGDPVDKALIESLAARLVAGQAPNSGWSYYCPTVSKEDQDRLLKAVKESSELKGRRELPKSSEAKPEDNKPGENAVPNKEKAIEFLKQVQILRNSPKPMGQQPDYSNTQFATLALWVARRQGLPVEGAQARVEQGLRLNQNRDGGWSYTVGEKEQNSSATMTGAGTLCLAIVDAAANELKRDKDPKAPPARDIKKDPNLKMGLAALASVVDHPVAKKKERGLPAEIPQVGGRTYYFLWTLERVCVALDLTTLGNKDWYNWGAEILLANQQDDGNWTGEFRIADTCFALLFLRRANLAKDLTVNLKGKLGDPGEVTLRTGGVGGDAFKGSSIKPAIEVRTSGKGLDDKTERGKIAKEIVEAKGSKQEKLIEKYRDEKGVTYTEALATAIPHLNGDTKTKARDALAERLSRMKAETLTNYLQDEEPEIRRAAAVACALKDSKAHIPQLIEMLRDKDAVVERGAVAALKELSGQNFGPPANATAAERDKAIAAWQEWWKKQQK